MSKNPLFAVMCVDPRAFFPFRLRCVWLVVAFLFLSSQYPFIQFTHPREKKKELGVGKEALCDEIEKKKICVPSKKLSSFVVKKHTACTVGTEGSRIATMRLLREYNQPI